MEDSENTELAEQTSLSRKRKALEPLDNSRDDSFEMEQEITIISRNSIGGTADEFGVGNDTITGNKRSNKIFVTSEDWSDWENDENDEKKAQKAMTTLNAGGVFSQSPEKRAKPFHVTLPSVTQQTQITARTPTVLSTTDYFSQLLDTATSGTVTLLVKQNNINNGNHLVCEDGDGQERLVYLDSSWHCTMAREGMIVRLVNVPKWGEQDFFVSNTSGGLLICSPDTLISSSNVANSYFCPRKTILRERFHMMCDTALPLLIGIVVHELVQWAVLHAKEIIVSRESLLAYWRETLCPTMLYNLVNLRMSPTSFEKEITLYIDNIANWFMKCIPRDDDGSHEQQVPLPTASKCLEVTDIEENFWEPKYGLKGKIDITVKVESPEGETFYEGVELKTGKMKSSIEHNAQVMLYSLMLESRYGKPAHRGNLIYLKDQVGTSVEIQENHLKYVIQKRNELAYYIANIGCQDLPPPKADPHWCARCEFVLPCSLYQQVTERGQQSTPEMFELAGQMTAHLNKKHFEYFKRWMGWLFEEWKTEVANSKPQSSLWNTTKEERENQHACIHSLRIEQQLSQTDGHQTAVFSRDAPFPANVFNVGDYVIISHSTSYAIRTANVMAISTNKMTLKFGTRLDESVDYFVDKYFSPSLHAASLGGVIMLLMNDDRMTKLRRLIIDCAPPERSYFQHQFPTLVEDIIRQAELNEHQTRAILACIYAKDYAIIEGLPGAGKTTVIAVFIACLVALGRTALLVSYTHSAVDNVLMKAKKLTNPRNILRLTRGTIRDDQLKELSLAGQMEARTSNVRHLDEDDCEFAKMTEILTSTPIVACTCHHISREPLFASRNKFDVTIVDEASMIIEPLLIPSLCLSTRFILIGDTKQLCPLVHSEQPRLEGMTVSLMEKLATFHPNSVYSLVMQYRMNKKLASLPSRLYYANRLVCANTQVSGLELGQFFTEPDENSAKIQSIISGSLEESHVFVNVKKDDKRDRNNHMCSAKEADCIGQICEALIKRGISSDAIGIMCTYRRQIDVITERLDNKSIEVSTVDMYQGRDKLIMILSLVWTSRCDKRCELLLEERRVNVALTRAKSKLILVGCWDSMLKLPTMKIVLGSGEEWMRVEWEEENLENLRTTNSEVTEEVTTTDN